MAMYGTAHPYNSENYSMSDHDCKQSYEETFYIIPRRIRKLPKITLAYLDVYETIFQFWNKQLPCYLSNATLQSRTGHGHTVVSDALKFFEEHGELERKVTNGRRFLVQPVRQIEIDTPPADAAPPSRKSGTPPPASAVHNIKKETNKETETTTTCSSGFSSFENKCLEFKHSTDERSNEEFLENVHHHVKLNSDPDSSEYQRQQMILKLLRNLHQNAAIFKSKGFVSKREQEVKQKVKTEKSMELMRNQWLMYYNSPVEIDCRAKGYESKTFDEWIKENVSS